MTRGRCANLESMAMARQVIFRAPTPASRPVPSPGFGSSSWCWPPPCSCRWRSRASFSAQPSASSGSRRMRASSGGTPSWVSCASPRFSTLSPGRRPSVSPPFLGSFSAESPRLSPTTGSCSFRGTPPGPWEARSSATWGITRSCFRSCGACRGSAAGSVPFCLP